MHHTQAQWPIHLLLITERTIEMSKNERIVLKGLAQKWLIQASHYEIHPTAEKTLRERARDLKGDVTTSELDRLLKPWT
ncbi:hypothetical protein EDD27_6021 [Nonomuraea polychroma]|uniref:Uncharacterized protein n=2 Tax=Nonomuraea polychroma TaxID=46176 RepID=A0A438MC80_9ACTN|nr:hypothetical protein EDD27_6021 [Nonomuraea polychroma]